MTAGVSCAVHKKDGGENRRRLPYTPANKNQSRSVALRLIV